jgi:hypothetical protein
MELRPTDFVTLHSFQSLRSRATLAAIIELSVGLSRTRARSNGMCSLSVRKTTGCRWGRSPNTTRGSRETSNICSRSTGRGSTADLKATCRMPSRRSSNSSLQSGAGQKLTTKLGIPTAAPVTGAPVSFTTWSSVPAPSCTVRRSCSCTPGVTGTSNPCAAWIVGSTFVKM